jgi:hypothetical protein
MLATFNASIRRPAAGAGGMLAEFFASNGADADATLILGRTDHQDALVLIVLQSGAEQLGEFEAYVRRPKPQISGMVARFFGEDGAAADRISALSLSRFVDSPVSVSVQLIKRPDGSAVESQQPAAKQPKGPHATAAALLWRSGFPARPEVWQALGGHAMADQTDVDGMRRWVWQRLKECFAVPSVADLDPLTLCMWARDNGVYHFLPKHYGDRM